MKLPLPVLRYLIIPFFVQTLSIARADDHDAHSLPAISAEPAAQLFVDAPLPGPLAKGLVVVPFRTEHAKIVPVYGEAATHVVPRISHLHITLDHASWHWLQTNDEPIVIQGLSHGPHQLMVELADANHHQLAMQTVGFAIP
ncbi:DUF6130 family protein [Glaciimonas soli]|uniref:DUF4399 domain-containing protein n=1 Tax=Glaciimonas soli TaxID=2590999 RepID=A0A843YVF6_9BURK|nr:DUF6130 family protein [Glaciimonas soli]MQR01281.1 hypothetical protein [Glaciimonas soli]